MFSYSQLVSRNFLFVNEDVQQNIRSVRLGFAGCGLSSVIAQMAARIGFTKFWLIDFDQVELSNLNRQAYSISHIGDYKCEALLDILLSINPEIEISIKNQKIINKQDIDNVINGSDVIINTIDYSQCYFDLVHESMRLNKLVICPFNAGFGGLVVCFNKDSGSLYDLLNTDKVEIGLEFDRKLIMNNPAIEIPLDVRRDLDLFKAEILKNGYNSQICIGAHMSASIVISCIVNFLSGKQISYCPSILYKGMFQSN